MRLIVDANILIGEALRARGRRLLSDTRLQLNITRTAWEETTYELPRRLKAIAMRQNLPARIVQALLSETLLLARRNLVIESDIIYAAYEDDARKRIPQDPDDWPSVALGLALGAGIWSEDRDFFGCGLATWTTPVLQHHLETSTT